MLPAYIAGIKDRPIYTDSTIVVISRVIGLILNAHDAADADANTACHIFLQRYLTRHIRFYTQCGDGSHHRVRPTGVYAALAARQFFSQ